MPLILNGTTGISGTDGSAGTPAVQGTDTNTGMFFPAADQIAFAEGGVEAMRLDASGNVGIGTSSPNADGLTVYRTNGGAITLQNAFTGTAATAGFQLAGGGGGDAYLWNYSNSFIAIGTNNAERARITSGGTLCLNTTGPTLNAKTPLLMAYQTAPQPAIVCYTNTTNAANQITFHNPNGEVGQINTGGTSTSYNTGSDYRLKENVVPLAGAAARVAALKPCRFNFIVEPDRTVDGFLAHEAAEVVPEAVHGEKDAVNEDGSIKPQGIDQSKLVPLLTAALQEALTEIASLKARVAALEAR